MVKDIVTNAAPVAKAQEESELPRTLRVFKVKTSVTAGLRLHPLICKPGRTG